MRLKNRARAQGYNTSFNYGENWKYFSLNETSQINFETYGARDYYRLLLVKVTVDLQRPNFANFVFFAPDIAKTSI